MKHLKSAEAKTLLICLLDFVVWTPFVFFVLYPFGERLVGTHHSVWLVASVNFLLQSFATLVIPILLWWWVWKPMQVKPLINTKKRARTPVLVMASVLLVALLTPFSVFRSPQVLMGLKLWVTGMCEEWQFRGMMTRVFQGRLGLVKSILVVSILFGVFHWGEIVFIEHQSFTSASAWIEMGSLVVTGLLFSWIVWRSGSLFWGGLVHGFGDWQPWLLGSGRPWPSDGMVAIVVGIVGAEVIRALGKRRETRVSQSPGLEV